MKTFKVVWCYLLLIVGGNVSTAWSADPSTCTPTLPAVTKTWTGAADTNWQNPGNWNPVGVPGADDHVLIAGATDATVVLSAGISVASLQLGADSGTATQTLVSPGYSFTFGNLGWVRRRGVLQWDGGELRGRLQVSGQLNWTTGRIRGGVQVCETGLLTLSTGGGKSLSSDNDGDPAFIDNYGTTVWSGASVTAWSGAQMTNRGNWQLTGDGVWVDFCCGGGFARLVNYGTLSRTVSAGAVQFGRSSFENYGVVDATSGPMEFPSGGTWQGGGRITGTASVRVTGGEHYFTGLMTLDGKLELAGGNYRASGRFTGPVPLAWTGGRLYNAMTIEPTARLEIRGDAGKSFSSDNSADPASITNRGTVAWTGGGISGWAGAQIQNLGTWRLESPGTWLDYCCGGDFPAFYNRGTLIKVGDTNATAFARVSFQNLATVRAESGPLVFPVHSQWMEGCEITGDGGVQLVSGDHYFEGLLNLNGRLELDGGNYRHQGRFTGPVPLRWNAGRVYNSLTVEPAGRLEMRTDAAKQLSSDSNENPAVITNRGTVVWYAGQVQCWAGAQMQNLANWRLEGSGYWTDYCCGGAGPLFVNRGTLTKAGDTNATYFARVSFQNYTTVVAESGPLVFPVHSQWMDGGEVTGTGGVQLVGGEHYFEGVLNVNGPFELNGGNYRHQARFTGPVPVIWNGGRLYDSMIIEPAGRLEMRSDGAKQISSDSNENPASITNRGTVVWYTGQMQGWAGALIQNLGTWRLEGAGTWMDYCCGGNWPSFYNQGNLTKTANTNDIQFSRVGFQNRGSVNVLSGSLQYVAYSDWQPGSRVNGSGGVQLIGGDHYITGLLTLNGPFALAGGRLLGDGHITGPVPLTLRSGRIQTALTIEPEGRMTIQAPGIGLSSDVNENPAAITNRGTVNWLSGGISAWSGARVVNRGEWHWNGGDTSFDFCCGGNWPSFDNPGEIFRDGTGTAYLSRTIFTSPGTVHVQSGDLEVQNLALTPTSVFDFSPSTFGSLATLPQFRVRDGFQLDGTVAVTLPPTMTLEQGQSFPLITGGTRLGLFAVEEFPVLPDGNTLSSSYQNNAVRAQVTEPCLANGLIGWWPGEGSASDVTGRHPGTLVNGATYAPGLNGQAFALNGQNAYVSLGGWSPGFSWTLEAWAQASALPAGRHTVLGSAGACLDWGLVLQEGQWGVMLRPPGGCTSSLLTGTNAVVGDWYHLAGTYDGQQVRFYLNGVFIGATAAEPNYIGYTAEARIGGEACCGNFFGGLVDEPAIYDHALKPAEIAALFQAGAKGRCAQYRLGVLRFSPTGPIRTNVARIDVRFNQPVRSDSFTAADLQIFTPSGLLPAAGITVTPDAALDQRSFVVTFAAQSAPGAYRVVVGPEVLDSAGNPMAQAYEATFTIDATGPRVISLAPNSPATNRVDAVDVTFDAPLNLATLQSSDLILTGLLVPSVGAPVALSNAVYRFPLSAPLAAGSYTVTVGPDLADPAGNLMDQNLNGTGGETNDVFTATLEVRAADLQVLSLVPPSLALLGDAVPVVLTITNAGTAYAVGPWQNAVLLADNAAGTGAITLGSFVFNGSLPPKSSLVITQQILLPATAVGPRWLGVTLDTQQQVVETVRNNNTRFASTSIAISAADLIVSAITAADAGVFGQNFNVRFTVKNVGTAATLAPWVDQIFLSPQANSLSGATLLSSVASSPLAVGANYTRTEVVTLPLAEAVAPGAYFLVVVADAANAQSEALETNNVASRPLALTLPPLPDLVVLDVQAPAFGVPGGNLAVSWAIKNQGNLIATGPWRESLNLSNLNGNLTLLGDLVVSNALAPGATLYHTRVLSLPEGLPAGASQLVVSVDADRTVIESNENNNAGSPPQAVSIPANLSLTLATTDVREDAPAFEGTLTRNSDVRVPLTVTLSNSAPAQLITPATVVIPVGQTTVTFPLQAVADKVTDGDQAVRLEARATDHFGSAAVIVVRDVDLPLLTLSLATNRVREGFTVSVTAQRAGSTNAELPVFLESSEPGRILVASQVTIPAGQRSVSFAAIASDNVRIEPPVDVTLTAVAPGYAPAQTNVLVMDDDLPAVRLTVASTNISEGGGPQATVGTVTRFGPVTRPVTLALESSLPGTLMLPTTVTIAAGRTNFTFPIAAKDDVLVNGSRAVELRVFVLETGSLNIVAEGEGVDVTVLDNDGPTLGLKLDRDLIREGVVGGVVGTVSRNTATTSPLVVTLTSSDLTEAKGPATVTIPAGQASATFAIDSLTDNTQDGNQPVTFTVTATDFTPASAGLVVSDIDLPDLVVTRLTGPASGETDALVSSSYRVENRGVTAAKGPFITRLFLSDDPLVGGDTLLGQYTYTDSLAPGQFFEQTLQHRLPKSSGTYRLIATTDAGEAVDEIREDNNTTVAGTVLPVAAAYTATVETDVTSALAGTPIALRGAAVRRDGSIASSVPVSIHITVRGFRRLVNVITDTAGRFVATFTPLPGEAGLYEIGAAHPGESTAPVQDRFSILGFRADPAADSLSLRPAETRTGEIRLTNLSDIALNGLSVNVLGAPPNLEIRATLSGPALPGFGARTLNYTVTVKDVSATVGSFGLRVTSSEGPSVEIPVQFTLALPQPQLVAIPGFLQAGMVRGGQANVEFDVVNVGGATSGPVTLSLPDVRWLSLATTNTLSPLAPGATNHVALLLTPSTDLDLGPYDGGIALNGPDVALTVPFQFIAQSDAFAELVLRFEDEFTYYGEGAPTVTNAVVTIRDPITQQVVTNGVADARGEFHLKGLREGHYVVESTAEKHTPAQANVSIVAGTTNRVSAFLSRELVEYVWSVVPTEIEDRTHIVIETIFETVVPAPVVTIEPSSIDLAEMVGDEMQVDLAISNHGLIAAQDFRLEFDAHPNFTFTPLIESLGTLPAQSSFVVPLLIKRVPDASGASGTVSIASTVGRRAGKAAGAANAPCSGSGRGTHTLKCGKIQTYVTPITLRNAGNCGGSNSGSNATGGPGGGSNYGYGCCGVGSGPGSAAPFVSKRTFKQEEKCDCAAQGFKAECYEIGVGSIGAKVPPQLLQIPGTGIQGKAEIKLNGSAKLCSCCEDGAEGWKLEGTANVSGTIGLRFPIVGGDFSYTYEEGGEKFGITATAGCFITPEVTVSGGIKAQTDCFFKNPKYCANFTAGGSLAGTCELGGGYSVGTVGGEAKISAGIKGGIEMSYSSCDDGTTEFKVCRTAVTAEMGAEFTYHERSVGPKWSKELLPEDCHQLRSEALSEEFADVKQQVDELAQRAFEDFFRQQPLLAQREISRRFFERPSGAAPASADGDAFRLDSPFGRALATIANELGVSVTPATVAATPAGGRATAGGTPRKQAGGEVCARVKLRLDQDLILTRNAFNATLELINRDPVNELEEINVSVEVYDSAGHAVTDRFGIRPPVLQNLSAVDGTGVVVANNSGSASFILVPTREAAPEVETEYFVGGFLSYRIGGQAAAIPLIPVPIHVRPDPLLVVQYFHERDVFSDDPFTRDIKEPTVPYNLAVMVANHGKGEARNVRIVSSQPKIVENEKGLAIDFKIIGTQVAGQSVEPSLTVNFGLIGADDISIGRWLLTSTLQGLFVDYKATFEHIDSLGKTNLSLVDAVTIHEMIHLVHADRQFDDGKPDFLVNDRIDNEDLPDTLYLSNGQTNRVTTLRQATPGAAVTAASLTTTLRLKDTPAGWVYLRVPEPTGGRFELTRVERPDGSAVFLGTNVWVTDRTFTGGANRPKYEWNLHLLDYDTAGTYTLFYSERSAADVTPPVSSVAPLPANSFSTIPVLWDGGDEPGGSGLAGFDVFVSENEGAFVPWLQNTTARGGVYRGQPGRTYSFYSVAIDVVGNREPAPLTPDATTTVTRANTAPTLTPVTTVIDEGQTLNLALEGKDAEAPPQTLTWSLGADAPPGVEINPVTGRLIWLTGEGTGPSTNTFKVTVRDNGTPSLSAQTNITVIVREVNSAPTLEPVASYVISEEQLLVVPFTAGDGDLPPQKLQFRLLPGGAAGATIDAQTGIFRWRPNRLQGPTTNTFVVQVADNGNPVLTATRELVIVVRDTRGDFGLGISSTNVFRGDSGTVILQLNSPLDLTTVSLRLDLPGNILTNLALVPLAPELASATLLPRGSDQYQVEFTAVPGLTLAGDLTLARLNFGTPTGTLSGVQSLVPSELRALRPDGSTLNSSLADVGRVVVVGNQPVLLAGRDTNAAPVFTLFGQPGVNYQVESTSSLETGSIWKKVVRVPLTTPYIQVRGVPFTNQIEWFRARPE